MKIVPEQLIPAIIEFSPEEIVVLRNLVIDRYKGSHAKPDRVLQILRVKGRFEMRKDHLPNHPDYHNMEYDRFCIMDENSGGGPVVTLSEFEWYCQKTGFRNGKQYHIT